MSQLAPLGESSFLFQAVEATCPEDSAALLEMAAAALSALTLQDASQRQLLAAALTNTTNMLVSNPLAAIALDSRVRADLVVRLCRLLAEDAQDLTVGEVLVALRCLLASSLPALPASAARKQPAAPLLEAEVLEALGAAVPVATRCAVAGGDSRLASAAVLFVNTAVGLASCALCQGARWALPDSAVDAAATLASVTVASLIKVLAQVCTTPRADACVTDAQLADTLAVSLVTTLSALPDGGGGEASAKRTAEELTALISAVESADHSLSPWALAALASATEALAVRLMAHGPDSDSCTAQEVLFKALAHVRSASKGPSEGDNTGTAEAGEAGSSPAQSTFARLLVDADDATDSSVASEMDCRSLRKLASLAHILGEWVTGKKDPTCKVVELAHLLERIDRRCGGSSVMLAVAVTPSLPATLATLLGGESEPQSGTLARPPVGTLFDLWLPLLAYSANDSSSSTRSLSEQRLEFGVRQQLSGMFLGAGGPLSLVEYLVKPHPMGLQPHGSSAPERTTTAAAAAVAVQVNLISSWNLLAELTGPCAPIFSGVTAAWAAGGPRAVRALLEYFVSLDSSDAVKAFLATPAAVHMLSTALALIPAMTACSLRCCDGGLGARLGGGGTRASWIAARLFPDEELLGAVATTVSTAAAAGCSDVLLAGLDALVTLAAVHPYAATTSIDFEFISEMLSQWAAAQQQQREESAEAEPPTERVPTVHEILALGSFRVMAALVPLVPQAVNLEWIETLDHAIRLLPFHRGGRSEAHARPALHDAFPLAVLPCMLATVEASEDARGFLFETDLCNILAGELQGHFIETAKGTDAGGASAEVSRLILAIAKFFPAPPEEEFVAAVSALLPRGNLDAVWARTAIPRAVAEYLDAATDRAQRDEACAAAFDDAFAAAAIRDVASVSVPALGTGDPATLHLIHFIQRQGPGAAVVLLNSIEDSPSEADLNSAMPDVLFLTAALKHPGVLSSWLGAGDGVIPLWWALNKCTSTSLSGFIAAAVAPTAAQLLICQQLAAMTAAVSTAPAVAHYVQSQSCHESTNANTGGALLAPLCDAIGNAARVQGESPKLASIAAALGDALVSLSEAFSVLLLSSEETAPALLSSEQWGGFFETVLVPAAGDGGVRSRCLLGLLAYDSVRAEARRRDGHAYAHALDALASTSDPGLFSLRLSTYKQELSK